MWKMLIGRRIQSERPLRRAGLPTRVRYERRLRSIFTNYAPTRAIARPTPSTERAVIMDATRAASQSSCLNSVRIGVLRHIDEFPTFNSCWIVSGQARSMVEILSRRMVFLPQPEPRSPIGPAPALFFPQHLQCVGGPVEQLLRDTRHRPVPHKCKKTGHQTLVGERGFPGQELIASVLSDVAAQCSDEMEETAWRASAHIT